MADLSPHSELPPEGLHRPAPDSASSSVTLEAEARGTGEGEQTTHPASPAVDVETDNDKISDEKEEERGSRYEVSDSAQPHAQSIIAEAKPPGQAEAVLPFSRSDTEPPRAKNRIRDSNFYTTCRKVFFYAPKRCRYDPANPPKFSIWLNLLFAVASTVTVANLYYNHPILNVLATDFHVTYEKASVIPTVMQAGYASGLLFICPLGDVLPRRQFVITLCFFTGTIWLGLCLTNNFNAFAALSFITAVTTVTPQLMLPLVGDLAPPARRATALSIVVSGLLLGMLVARFLSGVVTEFTSWRNIYWISFGLQYLMTILLWFFLPDYPVTNPDGINYFKMLWSIVQILTREPVLVQACFVGFCVGSIFTSYWTTLTFLLSSDPYNYNSLVIGLFAFIGIGAMTLGPLYSRLVIDKFVPVFSVILGCMMCMTGVVIGTFTGTFTVAGPIIQAFAIDLGLQTSQIANRSAIYGIAPKARNRVNTAYMVSVFLGQLTGTAVGNRLYAEGGWKISGSASIGFVGAALLATIVRSPWSKHWVGWDGGWSIHRRDLEPRKEEPAIEQALEELGAEEAVEDGSEVESKTLQRSGEVSEKETGEKEEEASVSAEKMV